MSSFKDRINASGLAAMPAQQINRRLAMLVIVLPMIVTTLYLLVFASSMHVAEAHFVIRGRDGGNAGNSTNILATFTGGGAAAPLDGYAVSDFLTSADALNSLDEKTGFREKMAGQGIDFLQSLPTDASQEQALSFYRSVVDVRYSLTEQIVTLKAAAYTPEDAKLFAAALLDVAEEFANRLNRRAEQATVKFAQAEVEKAEQRVAATSLAVLKWQQQNANFDPVENARNISSILASLDMNRAKARAELAEIAAFADRSSPQRRQIEARIRAIESQIEREKKRLTGSDDSVANQLLDFERLKTDQQLAKSAYESALGSLEQARATAIQQNKFVSVIVSPYADESADKPEFLRTLVSVLIGALVAFGIIRLMMSAILDQYHS